MRYMVDVVTYTKESKKKIESFPFDTIDDANGYVEMSKKYDHTTENGDFRRTFEPREV